MMEICFPTLNRAEWAYETIESVDAQCPVRVSWETEPHALTAIVNRLFKESYDAGTDIVIMLADHVRLLPGWKEAIEEKFSRLFPDLDGVIGFHMENMDPLPNVREFCFVAVGRKFLERFPRCQAFCPDYYHFYGDTEFGLYAKECGKFHYDPKGHPRLYSVLHGADEKTALQDDTHKKSTRHSSYDTHCWVKRKEKGFLWGRTFDRLYALDAETMVELQEGKI